MKASIALLTLIVICVTAKKGLALATFVDPTSGSLIAHFEGTENASTLTCNITNSEGFMTSTIWIVQNFRGSSGLQAINDDFVTEIFSVGGDPRPNDPTRTFRNRLTIVNFTAELDGVTVYCGNGSNRQQATFNLRVYRPPMIRDNVLLKVRENSGRIPVNLSEGLAAFPEPTFQWTKDGESLNGPILTYNSVMFSSVRRADAGNYTVLATNSKLNSTTPKQVGNDTGSFYLDVLFGPILTPGPLRSYVLLNDSLSLVCGTGLESNPQATITWTAPNGTTIVDSARYDLENGPLFVRLNFTHTLPSDHGVWICRILVESEQDVVVDGQLTRTDSSPIGQTVVNIELVVIAPPGPPRSLIVDSCDATSLFICWEVPLDSDSPMISFYTIIAHNLNNTSGMDDIVIRNTTNNSTLFNVTGLFPGTTYELTVVAVSQGGDIIAKSQPSEPATHTTGLTVPALMCNNPEFSEGGITARWTFVHTGGKDLTNVLVSYTFEEGAVRSNPISITNKNSTITSIHVPRLTAGIRYTFNITAVNDIGSSYILCGPTLLNVGIPFRPSFGDFIPGSDATQIRIQIKTVASGESAGFRFNIIPVHDGMEERPRVFMLDDYQSGAFVTLTVQDLKESGTYTFTATAQNDIGESEVASSHSIVIIPSPPQPGSNNAAIVGGVIGVLSVIIIIVISTIFVVLLHVLRKGKSGKIEVPIYDGPDSFRRSTANASDIELKECPAYEKLRKDTHIELEQCPAYGELHRDPSSC